MTGRRIRFAEPSKRADLFYAVLCLLFFCKEQGEALHVPHTSHSCTTLTVPGHKMSGMSWLYEKATLLQDLFPLNLCAYWLFTGHLFWWNHAYYQKENSYFSRRQHLIANNLAGGNRQGEELWLKLLMFNLERAQVLLYIVYGDKEIVHQLLIF